MNCSAVKDLNQQIIGLERIASHAWPAHDIQYLGGWMLRASFGITHRANSTLILNQLPEGDIDAAIQTIREFYIRRGLPPRFQLTEASVPANIDRKIADYGFVVEVKVNVQIASLDSLIQNITTIPVKLHSDLRQDWLATYGIVGEYDSFSLGIRKDIMERVKQEKIYASAILDGQVVGVGFGVVELEWIGLFTIYTLEKYRRQSVATAVTCSLARWALSKGATHAYLLVEQENEPGNALYSHLGFQTHHYYWYRIEREINDNPTK